MREALLLFSGGLGGAEIHAAVDGYGVATDDLAVEAFPEGEGERGFAAAGGAEDQDGERVLRMDGVLVGFGHWLESPPAMRKDPAGWGVDEAIEQDCCGDEKQADGLVAMEEAALFFAASDALLLDIEAFKAVAGTALQAALSLPEAV